MARNSEKAMTALARWRNAELGTAHQDRRPFLATECKSIQKCEKWRRQIIGEISRKVSQIQNAGLGEYKLRDINDEINKLLREKGHWEDQIKVLDGPDYRKIGPRMLDHDGKEVPGNRGYKYFGAAKDLPGVRDLFLAPLPMKPRKTCVELMRNIDADYYGYRDEDDNILLPIEQIAEQKAVKTKLAEYKNNVAAAKRADPNRRRGEGEEQDVVDKDDDDDDDDDIYKTTDKYEIDDASFQRSNTEKVEYMQMDESLSSNRNKDASGLPVQSISHISIPSQKEIEQALLQRKKQELMQRYVSDSMQNQAESMKNLIT